MGALSIQPPHPNFGKVRNISHRYAGPKTMCSLPNLSPGPSNGLIRLIQSKKSRWLFDGRGEQEKDTRSNVYLERKKKGGEALKNPRVRNSENTAALLQYGVRKRPTRCATSARHDLPKANSTSIMNVPYQTPPCHSLAKTTSTITTTIKQASKRVLGSNLGRFASIFPPCRTHNFNPIHPSRALGPNALPRRNSQSLLEGGSALS
ncbi:hypothetical protein QBC42DRAFT_276052 [Cladorrhinum samala]|uniref:Uncharacterized protein n=1 Tax=Cladorrhinum samala TaxID=585594 RepID=A0AAV9HGG7_9PEZI|nr:hypothetical protein QBC42DRAFT_276052 [Cladorrhinum samala]